LVLLHSSDKKLILLLFTFFFLINILSSGGHFDWWDGPEAFLVTESMALKHTAKLDPTVPSVKDLRFYVNYTVYASNALQGGNHSDPKTIKLEPVYTVRSLLLSAVAIPFYFLGLFLSVSPVITVALFVNPLIISLTAVVIFCVLLEIHGSKRVAFLLSLIFSVCSFIWPYNTTFWVQPLQGLILTSTTFFLLKIRHYNKSFLCHYTLLKNDRKRYFFSGLAGVFLGLSTFAHPTSLIFVPAFLTFSFFSAMKRNKRSFVFFVAVFVIVLFFVGLVNYARFGTFTEFGYGYFSSLATHNGWRGLIGLLVSPGVGLIFYFPLAIILPLGAKYLYKDYRALFFLCIYVIISNWIYVGTLSFGTEPTAWSGGIAWGPRYLIPVLPFMIIMLGSIFLRMKKRILLKSVSISLCVAGFFVNFAGVLTWVMYGYMYAWDHEGLGNYSNYMDIMTWFPLYSPIILHAEAIMRDYVSHIDPAQYINSAWYWAANGNAPCSYDSYIYCKYGAVPVLVLLMGLLLITAIIIKRLNLFAYYNTIRYKGLVRFS
jgi:hypothetical protein